MKHIVFKYCVRLLRFSLVLTTVMWLTVQGQTFEQSFADYVQRDYNKAFLGFQKLAAQGDARALHNLGVMYRDGYGVSKDEKQAVA